MAAISVVITAPIGVAACRYLDDLLAQADADPLEILIVDGSSASDEVGLLPRGVRRVCAPGLGIQALIARGVREASHDWVLVTEDHCRPLPGMIDSYRRAMRDNPQVDLFAGAAENLTSTSPWSFALFLLGLGDQWPPRGFPQTSASNANLLIRRSAMLAQEIAIDGGLLNLTVRRLAAEGRLMNCRNAVVDHVLHLSAASAVAFEFSCSFSANAVSRATGVQRQLAIQILRDVAGLLYTPIRQVWTRAPHLSGPWLYRLGIMARLAILAFTGALAACSVDMRRLLRNEVQEVLRTTN